MATHSAVCINNDLASRETRVTVRTSSYKAACRIYIELCLFIQESCWFKNRLDYLLDDCLFDFSILNFRIMLMAYDNCIDADRFEAFVFDCNLRLCVWTKPLDLSALAEFCGLDKNLVGIHYRSRHKFRSFVACKTEHHALVTSSLLSLEFLESCTDDTLVDVR